MAITQKEVTIVVRMLHNHHLFSKITMNNQN